MYAYPSTGRSLIDLIIMASVTFSFVSVAKWVSERTRRLIEARRYEQAARPDDRREAETPAVVFNFPQQHFPRYRRANGETPRCSRAHPHLRLVADDGDHAA